MLILQIVQLTYSVARDKMSGLHFFELRELIMASFGRVLASGRETAGVRRLDGAGDLTLDQDALALVINVNARDRGDQGLRVRMILVLEELLGIRLLHCGSEVHDHDVVENVLNNA